MKNIICCILLTCTFSTLAIKSSAQFSLSVGITVRTAPPPLPVYTQPPCPVDGWLWSPGYWAYDDIDGYYWVPGVWVVPPRIGYLWTPGYWGYSGGYYGWHGGYWGTHIGFYGGVNYGYGYCGSGFVGGAWQGGSFRYNTAVVNVNTTVVHNTYIDRTVINNTTINNTTVNNRSSFNGPGGITARPSAQEQMAMHESHVQPTSAQFSHNQVASHDRNQFASVNKGRPVTAAMDKPGGTRFNPQGSHAPAPVSRPTDGIKAASNHANGAGIHPANRNNDQVVNHGNNNPPIMNRAQVNHGNNNPPNMNRAQVNQARPVNRAPQQNINRPVQQQRPRQQAPRNNPQPPHGGGEGSHHKER